MPPPIIGMRFSATPPPSSVSEITCGNPKDILGPSHRDDHTDTMHSLPPYNGNQDLDKLITAAIDTAQPPDLIHLARSATTALANITNPPSPVATDSTEPMQSYGGGGAGYREDTLYEDVLFEAEDKFCGKKPDFVITSTKLEFTRMVDLGHGQIGEMKLETWDESKRQGFWTLEDRYGDKHIVKFFPKGKCYRAWRGTDDGYDETGIAWPEKTRSSAQSSTASDSDKSVVVDKHEDSDDEGHSHSLRRRTWTQEHPYKADKEMHAAAKAGKVKRKSDIDTREARHEGKTLKKGRSSTTSPGKALHTHTGTTKASKRSKSGFTTPSISDLSELSPEEFQIHVKAKTSLLTKLPPDNEPLPVYLSDCPDVTALWEKIVSMWESDIEGTVKSMSIKFPWLSQEYGIKLKAGLPGCYDKMMEVILDAPCWKDGTDKCSVEVVLVLA